MDLTEILTEVPEKGTLRILTDGEKVRIVLPAYATWVEITPEQASHVAATILHLVDLITVVSDNPSMLKAQVDLRAKESGN